MNNNKLPDIITDLSVDIAEPIIDSFLNDGLLKDVPLIGVGVKIINLTTNISDKMLLSKLKMFLKNINIISEEKIKNFKEKMEKDKFREEIGIKLLNIINKTDEYIKIKWIAIVFSDYLEKKIDKSFFFKIITIINNAFVQDLIKIKLIEKDKIILSNNKIIDYYVLDHLFSIGLLGNHGIDAGSPDPEIDNGIRYALNPFGEYIKEIIERNNDSN